MVKKLKVYISGQITGLSKSDVVTKFFKAEQYLQDRGLEVINPLKVCGHLDEKKSTWKIYMVEDIKALLDCDLIYMLDNWGNSKGARVEYAIAQSLGLNIMFEKTN